MVSRGKRFMCESASDDSKSDGSDGAVYINGSHNDIEMRNSKSRSPRKTKCFSKNALMARENRLRKKMYLSNLEHDLKHVKDQNKTLSSVIDNQSFLISELKTEVKYLKSVLANSTEISRILHTIHQNTGMSVSTSLDKSLKLNNDYVSKPILPIARKTAHPWEEPKHNCSSILSPGSSPLHETQLDELDIHLGMDLPPLDDQSEDDDIHILNDNFTTFDEHNYTASHQPECEDVGVCLHISKRKVSLEFCPSCNDNAKDVWMD